MKLKQISIFLENSPGRLYEATQAFGEAGINLRSLSICDTSDYGVLRVLVSDLTTARRVMMEKHFPARVDEVVAAEIADSAGSLAKILKMFLGTAVNVMYMYAVAGVSSDQAAMVFRFSDNDRAIEILQANDIRLLDPESFGILDQPG